MRVQVTSRLDTRFGSERVSCLPQVQAGTSKRLADDMAMLLDFIARHTATHKRDFGWRKTCRQDLPALGHPHPSPRDMPSASTLPFYLRKIAKRYLGRESLSSSATSASWTHRCSSSIDPRRASKRQPSRERSGRLATATRPLPNFIFSFFAPRPCRRILRLRRCYPRLRMFGGSPHYRDSDSYWRKRLVTLALKPASL